MKIFLCCPPTGYFIRDERCQIDVHSRIAENIREPIQLLYLAGLLQKKGYEILLNDYCFPSYSIDNVVNDCIRFKPDCVCIETTQGTFKDDIKFINKLHTSFRDAYFILKSPFIDLNYLSDYIKYSHINSDIKIYFIVRDFEQTILNILKNYHTSNALDNVYLYLNGKIIPPESIGEKNIFDMDEYPIPPRNLLNKFNYVRPYTGDPIAYIYTSNGCPYDCIFCSAPIYLGRKVQTRSVMSVINEIEDCIKNYNIRNFFFRSDTFTIDKEWVMQFCKAILDRKLNIKWGTNSRTDTIDAEMLELMKSAGCDIIGLGIESGSDFILKNIKKNICTDDVERVHKLIKKFGIKTFFHCIIGFPWDSRETINQTKKFLLQVKPDFVEVNVPYPLNGTELYELAERHNLFVSKEFETFSHIKPILRTFSLSADEIEKLRKNILMSFYFRPGFIFEKFKYINKPKVFLNYTKWGYALINKIFM